MHSVREEFETVIPNAFRMYSEFKPNRDVFRMHAYHIKSECIPNGFRMQTIDIERVQN